MISNEDLSTVPVSVLKKPTLNILSSNLNFPKVIPTSDGLPRDWRGIAYLLGLNSLETNKISTTQDPFLHLINSNQLNLGQLQDYLVVIDRCDVLDDTAELFESDAAEYLQHLNSGEELKNVRLVSTEADDLILTVDDVVRLEKGLKPQTYDGYLLYADEDYEFAKQIIDKMEGEYKMKLCIRDRDLIGGITFEHDAIMKLIAERCRRLIVVVSDNFLKSQANKFFVTFAQALGIDQRQRKVVPILYEKCQLPPELSYYFLLDYSRAGKLWNFWDKLNDSIQAPDITTKPTRTSKSDSVTSDTSKSSDIWMSPTKVDTTESEESVSECGSKSSTKKSKMNKFTNMLKTKLKFSDASLTKQEKTFYDTNVPTKMNNSLSSDSKNVKTDLKKSSSSGKRSKLFKKKVEPALAT